MPKVTADMMITLDDYAAGEGQSLERPFGDIDTDRLEAWRFDHAEEIAAITAAGAYIMGRNMFGPDRGEWDLDWHGWWGPNPPYHAPTSSSATVRARASRWRAAPSTTSSPTGESASSTAPRASS